MPLEQPQKISLLGTKRGKANRCGGRGCKTCEMLITDPVSTVGQKKIKLTEGTCRSNNICYLAQCSICEKSYTGRTVDPLQKRINGHRHCYKEILRKVEDGNLQDIDTQSDLYMLGLHLHNDHGKTDQNAFDDAMKFGILDVVNPTEIEKKEFIWMHRLNTFQPVGINTEYPFGIPYLGQT